MPLGDEAAALVSGRLQTALLRESVALVEGGTATPRDVDSVVTTTIGRRLAVGGPFEIWEQIGWDLVQVIAGALLKEISNAVEISASLESTLHQTVVPTKNLIRTVCVTDRAVLGRRTITSVGMADVRSVEVDGRLASFGRSSGRRVSVHGLQAPAIRGCGQAACRW